MFIKFQHIPNTPTPIFGNLDIKGAYLHELKGNYIILYDKDGNQNVGGKKSKRTKKYKRNNNSKKSRKVKRRRKK